MGRCEEERMIARLHELIDTVTQCRHAGQDCEPVTGELRELTKWFLRDAAPTADIGGFRTGYDRALDDVRDQLDHLSLTCYEPPKKEHADAVT